MTNKANLMMHPIRMRILLNLSNREMTSRELSELLADVPQATLYRHIKTLKEARLLRVVKERKVRNTTEKVYTLEQGGAALTAHELAQASNEEHSAYFTVFVSSLLADFTRYIESENSDPLTDGMGYTQLPLNLTDKELSKLMNQINALILPLMSNEPGENRRRRVLTTILIPDDHEPPDIGGGQQQTAG